MPVPADVICLWPSTAASIPAGWSRDTRFDGKYVQGAPALGDADFTARGNANHTHTSAAHTPLISTHAHTMSSSTFNKLASPPVPGVTDAGTHSHTGGSSGATIATNQSSTVNFGANTSNDILYIECIFIKSSGSPAGLPNGCRAYFESDTFPTGWTRQSANRFIRGAAAAGDGGGTGGATTHTHQSDSHTHIQNPHSHAATASTLSTFGAGAQTLFTTGGTLAAADQHAHNVSLDAATATNTAVVNTSNATNHEPPWWRLNFIGNGTGGDSLPPGIICLWPGTHAAIPAGWERVVLIDGSFVKHAGVDEQSGLLNGGTSTHTHGVFCQPVQNSHTHTATDNGVTATIDTDGAVVALQPGGYVPDVHTHTWSVTTDTALSTPTAYTMDACSAEAAYPPYVRAIWIRLLEPQDVMDWIDTLIYAALRRQRRSIPVRAQLRRSATYDFDSLTTTDAPGFADYPVRGEFAFARHALERRRLRPFQLQRSFTFDYDSVFDEPGFADPFLGGQVAQRRALARRGMRPARLQRSASFDYDSLVPVDVDGLIDPVRGESVFAQRRLFARGDRGRQAQRRSDTTGYESLETVDAPGESDPNAGAVAFGVRRWRRGARAAAQLRRSMSFEAEAPFDFDGEADPVTGELVFATLRAGRRRSVTRPRALQFDPDAPFDEPGESGPIWGLSAARRRPLRWRAVQQFETEELLDEPGFADPVWGELVFATRRARQRGAIPRSRIAYQFDPESPFDEDGSLDPVAGEIVFAVQRALRRLSRPRARIAYQSDPDAPFEFDGGPDWASDHVFATRRRQLRAAALHQLRRTWSWETEFSEEAGAGAEPVWGEHVFATRRLLYRPRPWRPTWLEEELFPPEDPGFEPVLGEMVFAIRRRAQRVRPRPVSIGEDPEFVVEDPGFEPMFGELVFATRRLRFRGQQLRATLYRGKEFELEAPDPPERTPAPSARRVVGEYVRFEMFHRQGIKLGRRTRR